MGGWRKVLGLDGSSEYVTRELERANRDILRYESIFIAFVSLSVLASTFFPLVPWAGKPDSLTVRSINQERRTFFNSATGVWWPAQPKSSRASFPRHAAKSGVL